MSNYFWRSPQGDGKIVAAGYADNGSSRDFAVARYTTAGGLDTGFDGDGILTTSFGGSNDLANGVAIDGDGKIVVAGDSGTDMAVARYLDNGALDPVFSSAGKAVVPVRGGADHGYGVAVQSDGRIVVAGSAYEDGVDRIALVRMLGTAVPEIEVEQPAGTSLADGGGGVDFGGPTVGGTPVSLTFTVRNIGAATLTGLAVMKDGANADDFTVDALGATSLAAGASTTFTVSFAPSAPGARTAALHLPSNDTSESSFDIPLHGVGNEPPQITSTSPLPQGMGYAAYSFTFSATGGTPPYTWDVSAGSLPSSFALSSSGVLTGTATMGMTANFIVRATGANGLSSTKAITLPIIRRLDPGHLDPSFGTGGNVTTNLAPGADDCGQAVAVVGGGKILVAGYARVGATDDFALARYWPDGRLDTSFGTGGVVTTAIGSGNDYGRAVAVKESFGLIVVAGETWNGASWDFAVAAYGLDGQPYPDFGTGGKVVRSIGSGNDYARAVAVQSDNKIVVAGETAGGSIDFAVMRLLINGDMDFGFGAAGVVTTDLGGNGGDRAYGMALQADDRIVVAGSTPGTVNDDFAVVRYLTNGALDAGFNGDGIVVTPMGSETDVAKAVALQTDGKIVVAGDSHFGASDLALARYLPDGSLDPDFSGDGKALTTLGSAWIRAASVAIDSGGRIVVAGSCNGSGSIDMALVRHSTAGNLDLAFGYEGIQVTAVGSGEDRAHGVAITPGGGIVAAGCAHNGTDFDFAVTGHAGLLVPEILVEDLAVPWVPLTSVDFGAVPFGASSSRQIKIRNVGTASLTGLGLNFGAGNATPFPVSALPTTSLAPGAGLTLTASFVPTLSGNAWAVLSVASNDSDENPHRISFTGIGGYTPLEAWRFTYFGNPAGTGDGADTNDFDKDGCVNFLEYALGGNPTVPDPGTIQPKVVIVDGRPGIAFNCRADRPEVKYFVEMAPTLPCANWYLLALGQNGGLVQPYEQASEVSDPGGTVRSVTVFPAPSLIPNGRGFMRVRLSP